MVRDERHPGRGVGRRLAPRYALIVAQPTITSPRSRQADWPGAAPWNGSSSSSSSRAPVAAHAAADGARVVAQPDRVDLAARAGAAARRARARGGSRAASRVPTTTRFARASVRSTYSGSACGDAEPLALADGEVVEAVVRADDLAVASTISPGASSSPAWRAQERRLAGAGEEAQVLRVGAARDRQLGLRRQLAHLRLGQLGQREAHPRQRRRRQRRRACRSGPSPDRPRRAAARPR